MRSVNTEIVIAAPPSAVRQVFLDFASYPQWNPFITRVIVADPAAPPGSRFEIIAFKFYPDFSIIMKNDPGEFTWTGHIIANWIFRGHHVFKFEPQGDEVTESGEPANCKFIQLEEFGGFLKLFSFIYGPILRRGFIQMNEALKTRVETSTTASGE